LPISKELLVLVVPAMAVADLGVAGQPEMGRSAFLVASGRIRCATGSDRDFSFFVLNGATVPERTARCRLNVD